MSKIPLPKINFNYPTTSNQPYRLYSASEQQNVLPRTYTTNTHTSNYIHQSPAYLETRQVAPIQTTQKTQVMNLQPAVHREIVNVQPAPPRQIIYESRVKPTTVTQYNPVVTSVTTPAYTPAPPVYGKQVVSEQIIQQPVKHVAAPAPVVIRDDKTQSSYDQAKSGNCCFPLLCALLGLLLLAGLITGIVFLVRHINNNNHIQSVVVDDDTQNDQNQDTFFNQDVQPVAPTNNTVIPNTVQPDIIQPIPAHPQTVEPQIIDPIPAQFQNVDPSIVDPIPANVQTVITTTDTQVLPYAVPSNTYDATTIPTTNTNTVQTVAPTAVSPIPISTTQSFAGLQPTTVNTQSSYSVSPNSIPAVTVDAVPTVRNVVTTKTIQTLEPILRHNLKTYRLNKS